MMFAIVGIGFAGLAIGLQTDDTGSEIDPAAANNIRPADTRTHLDVAYCNTKNPSQTLDIYMPPKNDDTVPLLVYIHGGGWNQGTKVNGIQAEYVSALNDINVGVASVGYRLSTEATYPAQNEDVACAAKHLFDQAGKYKVNAERVFIMGDSAGGHLAAMEVVRDKHDYHAAILAYGVTDLWEQIQNHHDKNAVQYLGARSRELANKNSPYFADLADSPDFLIIHGTADTVVPVSESQRFADKLRKVGVYVEYIPIKGAVHGFFGTGDDSDRQARDAVIPFVTERI